MKQFKNLVALVLVAVMSLALVGSALAANSTITIENKNPHISIDGKTYTAWKLFDAEYTPDGSGVSYSIATNSYFYTTSNIKTELDKYFTFTVIPGDDSKVVVTKKDTYTDATARTLADALQQYLNTTDAAGLYWTSPAAASETATISVPGPGYYLITGTAAAKDDATNEVTSAVGAVSVNGTVTIHPKADVPTLDKKAKGDVVIDTAGEQAIAQVGQEIEFEITATIPDTTGYTTYTYTIHDSWTDGLTYKADSYAVTKDGTAYTGGTFTLAQDAKSFTYTVPKDDLTPAGKEIKLTYKAILNDGAVTTDFERNTAYLEYSNNPYNDQDKDRTPDEHVWVIDLNIDVDKVAGSASGSKLAGAKFKLYKGDGTGDTDWYSWNASDKKVVWTSFANAAEYETDANGKLNNQFQGLTQGTYHLRETVPPTGYNALATDPELVIVATPGTNEATITANGETITNGTVSLTKDDHTAKQPVAVAQVINNAGTELPSTGGIGTTIFYVAGIVLVLGAAAIIIARRKAEQE